MGSRRNGDGRLGDVDAENERRGQLCRVAPFAAPHVEDDRRALVAYKVAQGVGYRVKRPGRQEAVTGGDHFVAVARHPTASLPREQQIDVTPAGNVEAMTERTGPLASFRRQAQAGPADRAAPGRNGCHEDALSGGRSAGEGRAGNRHGPGTNAPSSITARSTASAAWSCSGATRSASARLSEAMTSTMAMP